MALPPGHLTPLLREWVVHLGSWVPFVQVPRLLAYFAGLTLNRETARRHTEAAGADLLAAETRAAPAVVPPADPGPATPQRLQLSADGAMVRLQCGEWVEVKTLAVGQVGTRTARDGTILPQTREISYFSRHAPVAEFTAAATRELHRRGVRAAAAVAGVMDGALWLQGFLDYHRPDAVRILDLPHAAEHLGALAAAVWGESSATARTWQAAQVTTLRDDGPAPVLAAIAPLQARDPQNEALAAHAEYLRKRTDQMDYPQFRAAGWPVGSGIVESANKLVVDARLKGAGMGWGRAALNPMLSLRNAVCNDRWAEAWGTITAEQTVACAQPRQRQTGAPAPEPSKDSAQRAATEAAAGKINHAMVAEVAAILERVTAELDGARAQAAPVNGKPGPRHPWRHSPISKVPGGASA